MSIARRPATLWVTLLLLVTVLVGPAKWQPTVRGAGPTVSEALAEQQAIEDELARQRAQLADLQREQADLAIRVRDLATEIASVGPQIEAAQHQLEALTADFAQAQGELRSYDADIASLGVSLTDVATEIDTSQGELAARVALLQDHLRSAYEQSQSSILEVLLSTDSFTTASTRLSAILSLTDEDRRLATEIGERRLALEHRGTTLSLGHETIAALRVAAAARADALATQGRLLADVRDALQVKLSQLEALRDARDGEFVATSNNVDQQAAQIAAQQQLLEGQAALVQRLRGAAAALDLVYRGRFEWPERGDFIVTQEFGPTSFDPSHRGIDMAYVTPRCGGPIYAAADGVVLDDGRPLAQSGDSAIGVIIGHSQRLQTWYWHLSREIVSVGQQVRVGDIIGYEGMTGLTAGCHVHFQVSFDDQPVNPRLYLP
jgi:murein DD-endopeptidase MepM/ murein hydrolase activator NlpD